MNNQNLTLQESVQHNSHEVVDGIQLLQQWKLNRSAQILTGDYPIQESKRFFSSAPLSQKPNLFIDTAQFITGFADGEACFNVSIFKDNTFKLGWRVKLTFIISLHSRDKEVLEFIQNYFKVGGITKQGSKAYQFRVSSIKDLAVIINHFDKYPLITQKFADYELFKQAYHLIINKEHVKEEGLHKIIAIKASMNLGNSVALEQAFPSIVPADRLKVENIVCDPNWIAGFTSGEGSFYINIKKSPTVAIGYNVVLVFQLVQHSRDEFLIKSLIEFFKCGNVRYYKDKKAVFFRVEKFSDLISIIIPFFRQYPIKGVKSKDFQDWCRVALLVKDKKHLTREGLENIRQITAGMNKGRSIEEIETIKVLQKNKTTSTLIHKRGLHSNALFSNIRRESSLNRSTPQPLHSPAKWELSGDYVAGFVQADGSFSATLTRKTRGDKEYFNISLVFTIVQGQKYKELILEIQKKFGGIGHWYINKKDKSIRYQVTNQSDLLNVIIPFFMKHQLRSGKLLSFLRFKYIVEVMSSRAHWNNKKVLLSLIVIASHMNPLGKLGNKIKYLTPDEQKYVIDNVQPEGVDISKLTESIKSFKQNKLTLEFIHGLFDGDGGLSVYFGTKSSSSVCSTTVDDKAVNHPNLSIGFGFTIVQDSHNLSLLNEIKSYFNDRGGIYKINENCSIYKVGSKSDLISVVLPKMANKESIEWVNDYRDFDAASSELNLPLLKYNKIFYSCKILKLLSEKGGLNKENINDIIMLSYYVRQEFDNLSLEEYIEKVKQKYLL